MYRLRVFESRVLRRIIGSKDEINRGLEKTAQQRALRSTLLTRHYLGDQIKKNQMDRACNMYGRQEICIQGFSEET
jgi:hypothetical protein